MRPQDRRPQIDPKTLHKRRRRPEGPKPPAFSAINRVDAAGRTLAPGGYTVAGQESRGFETFTRYVMAHQAIEMVVNPKKDRAFRVLRGSCIIETLEGDDKTSVATGIETGDEVLVPGGTPHRVVTVGSFVELLVIQAYKYEAALEQLEDAIVTGDPITEVELMSPDEIRAQSNPNLPRRRPYGMQKAQEQQLEVFKTFKPDAVPQGPPPVVPQGSVPINIRPTGGADLDPSLAG